MNDWMSQGMYEIKYDDRKGRFEVSSWFLCNVRYFNTKRSAIRFVRRVNDKMLGIKPKKKKRTWAEHKEKQDNEYLERLGAC